MIREQRSLRVLAIAVLTLLMTSMVYAQTVNVSGSVVDADDQPIPGATVQVLNKAGMGTLTDLDGKFKLDGVPTQATLRISYVGMKSVDIPLNGRTTLSIVLKEDTELLDEVVVTALGIKRSEKALSYNVQEIKNDELTRVKDVNFINALSGKVAGVNINASSAGIGGASKVVMRGTKSIEGTNNALYVIDGIPMYAQARGAGTEFASTGVSDPIADLNPEDIESMSVLTGAAAAALYGSAAANGAIVVTTKKGKEGRVRLSIGSSSEWVNAMITPRLQNRYGTGSTLRKEEVLDKSWGKKLNDRNNYGYDPAKDFLKTGNILSNNISLSAGNAKHQTYFSAASVHSAGIVPNNKYNRYNINLRHTTTFLDDKMTLDLGAGYVKQYDRNMVNQGVYGNPLTGAYLFPKGDDWSDIRMYERYDETRKLSTQYWPVGSGGTLTMQNPYWVAYRNVRENNKDRYMLNASLSYKILDWLTLSGRMRIDNSTNDYSTKNYASTNNQLTEGSERGLYGIQRMHDKQTYGDVLLSINKHFGEAWTLDANIGASISDMRSDLMEINGPIADGTVAGEPAGLANFFAIQNLSASKTKKIQDGWREQTQALYGSLEVGYRSMLYLTLTGRNDWPSQLAGPKSVHSSFFYPSVGLSAVISEMMEMPRFFPYLKIRGSFASVGTPFPRFIANPRYQWDEKNRIWKNTTVYPMYNLLPERTDSYEIGVSAKLLGHVSLDLTYYNAITGNQTFDPNLGGGAYSKMYVQTGAVRNQGVELSIGYSNTWDWFGWSTGYTFSTNKNEILRLAEDVTNPVTGTRFSIDALEMGGLGDARFILRKGGSMGDLYSRIDVQRDSNGDVQVGPNHTVTTVQIKSQDQYIKLGSVLPKANMAWRNDFSIYGVQIGCMISARLGGVVYSRTQGFLDEYGVSEPTAEARDRGYVLVNGGDYLNPEAWYGTIGNKGVPQYYTYSATNVRLQEASIGYTIPRKWLGDVCDLTVTAVGRNLLMLYNKAPFDPESVATTGNFYDGIDYFMMPSLRSLGISLNMKF